MIRNKTNGKILARRVHYCDSFFTRGTGLMFRSHRAIDHTGWVFDMKATCHITITMFFVFFPIDIVFLDASHRITELHCNVRPFTNFSTEKPARYFIELQQGTIDKASLAVGQHITFS